MAKKIYNKSLNKDSRIINFNSRIGNVGKSTYLPSFSKEWKNVIYSYNKNTLKNIPTNNQNINSLIQSYFNLNFKELGFIGPEKRISRKLRRNILTKIYVSKAEIKHTNNKAIITLFTFNRERKILQQRFLKINRKITNLLFERYFLIYSRNIGKIFKHFINIYKNPYLQSHTKLSRKVFWNSKFYCLQRFLRVKKLFMMKIWNLIINRYKDKQLSLLRKYSLLYTLNQHKFSNAFYLPKLGNMLGQILDKKIEFNIINLKSVTYHPDIFTNILALKLQKDDKQKPTKVIENFLQKGIISRLQDNFNWESKWENFVNNHKDLTLSSNIENNLDQLLETIHTKENTRKEIHNSIFNSINYKNTKGIRIELKGRLSKRSRADRASRVIRWRGGLRNTDSSNRGLSSVLFRGNTNSNTSYTIVNGKRRLGAFAVKGWIAGK